MNSRSTSLGYGGMTTSFNYYSTTSVNDWIKNHSFFNQLMLYALDNLCSGNVDSYELFRTKLNFNVTSDSYTKI